jgi:hypothetical protein
MVIEGEARFIVLEINAKHHHPDNIQGKNKNDAQGNVPQLVFPVTWVTENKPREQGKQDDTCTLLPYP